MSTKSQVQPPIVDEFYEGNDADLAKATYTGANVNGYTIDKNLSGNDYTTYVNSSTGQAIVAFSGTRIKNFHNKDTWRDISTDAGMVVGQEEHLQRFKNAEDVTNKAIAKYGKNNVKAVGHSLGGAQAMYVSSKTGVKATVFNPYIDRNEEQHYDPNARNALGIKVSAIDKWFAKNKWADNPILYKGYYDSPRHNRDYSNVTAYVVAGDPVVSGIGKGFNGMTVNQVKPTHGYWDFGKNVLEAGAIGGSIIATEGGDAPLAVPALAKKTKDIAKNVGGFHAMDNFMGGAVPRRPIASQPNMPVPPKSNDRQTKQQQAYHDIYYAHTTNQYTYGPYSYTEYEMSQGHDGTTTTTVRHHHKRK